MTPIKRKPGRPRLTHEEVVARFRARTREDPETGCWPWTGGRASRGYGRSHYDGRDRQATHVALALADADGKLPPPGLYALHKCDNPPCVRPDHLFLGTQRENMADARAKGRAHDAPASRSAQDRAYLALFGLRIGLTQTQVARSLGISSSRVCQIARERREGRW